MMASRARKQKLFGEQLGAKTVMEHGKRHLAEAMGEELPVVFGMLSLLTMNI